MNNKTIWVVMDGDNDGDWIVAAYDSEALANDHVDRTGVGHVDEVPVRSVLTDDAAAIDPVVARRDRERQLVANRATYELDQKKLEEQQTRVAELTIGDRASLCHCRTFITYPGFITPNGYCQYCGGWTLEVFRARFGDDGLANAIDLLAHHDRVRMRQFAELTRVII